MKQLVLLILVLCCAWLIWGCDRHGRPIQEFWMEKLSKGVSTESEVRMLVGQPGTVWEHEDGSRTLEYPKGPEGDRTWMFDIGSSGTLVDYRQVLSDEYFRQVQPGMSVDSVRRLLGKPRSTTQFKLRNEEVWDWLYTEVGTARLFHVHFDLGSGKVTQTSASDLHPG